MLFNSYEYIFIFLPFVFFTYFYLNSKKLTDLSKGFLVFASLFFYSWWNILYLPILLSSMLFNYSLGKTIVKDIKNKKGILTFGIVANISLLLYFKYADFFINNTNFLFSTNIDTLSLALPLAISFFTFQQIAYLVDSYKGETKEYDFLNYSLFVSFFPQLIAGPIVHHKEMMPQFANIKNKVKNYNNIALGIFIFSIGLFKKVTIADTFAKWATNGFDNATTLTFLEGWVTSLSYTFQLYFDFSGYSDMAIGIALLFNIRLPINFNSPYKALSIQDFWRRWHITLSNFLRDYIYIPLGGNRGKNIQVYSNLMVTFLIGGLWHGAGWTFVFWGFLHGLALVIHRIWQKIGIKLHSVVAWFITFNFINIAWVFFRAKEFDDAIKVLSAMVDIKSFEFAINLSNIDGKRQTLIILALAFIVTLFFKNSMDYYRGNKEVSITLMSIASIFFVYSIFTMQKVSEFIYFNF
jgi:D-alanyl-lipoteichoic acid acyltransferase DltB (MBOAT superfamily)